MPDPAPNWPPASSPLDPAEPVDLTAPAEYRGFTIAVEPVERGFRAVVDGDYAGPVRPLSREALRDARTSVRRRSPRADRPSPTAADDSVFAALRETLR